MPEVKGGRWKEVIEGGKFRVTPLRLGVPRKKYEYVLGNISCVTTDISKPYTRKRTIMEELISSIDAEQSCVEETGATLKKQSKATETGQSSAEQRGKKRKSDEEKECESPVRKRRAAQSPAKQRGKKRKSDEEKECESPVRKRRRATQSPAEQRGKKRKSDEEKECESPVRKRRAAQSPAKQRGKKRKSDEEKECESPVRKRRRATQSPAEQRGKKRKSDKEKECESSVRKRRRATQSPAAKRGKKRKSKKETECESHVMKRRRSEEAGEDWRSLMDATESDEEYTPGSLNLHSFIYHTIIDKGNFGKVALATHRDTGRLMVVKMICKRILLEHMDEDSVRVERHIMEIARGNPYCIYAYAAFETEECMYYVMDYMRGGDLNQLLLYDKKTLDLTTLRLLTAELLCGLHHLHSKQVLHRDLASRNILVDGTGHVKIADYGLSVANVFGSNMAFERVGDPEIAAPEIHSRMPYELAADYFALGILLFKAAFGEYPFKHEHGQLQHPILLLEPCYPDNADPILVGFLNKLLCKDPQVRKAEVAKIREDPFFNGINWKEVEAREARPPFSVCRKGFRNMTREELPMHEMSMDSICVLPEDQLLFNDVPFVTEEWIAMQRLKR